MQSEVVIFVPMVIVQALQLDDESVCEVYGIKRLSGGNYLFGVKGLCETLIDAEDRIGDDPDALLSYEEWDIWAGLVIDGMKVLRDQRNPSSDLDAVDQRFL